MEEKEITIDFSALWKLLLNEKWKIFLTGMIFSVLAAIWVFNKPNEYTSISSVMPEFESTGIKGGLSKYAGLASLAGINLGDMGGSDAIRPDLYPNVINNTTFFLFLLEQKVKLSNGSQKKFEDFYLDAYDMDKNKYFYTNTKNQKVGITDKLRNLLGIAPISVDGNSKEFEEFVFLSKAKGELLEDLSEKVSAGMDKKTGIISVSAVFPDPLISAQVANISMNYLTNFVERYRTEKARHNLDFLAKRLIEAKGKYYNTQSKKAQYNDQFSAPTIRLQSADIQRERIESDYRVSSSFYQELLQQYETAKLKVLEETPVFKILQPPVVPFKKSGPKRVIVIIFSMFFGAVVGTAVLLLRKKKYKQIFRINQF